MGLASCHLALKPLCVAVFEAGRHHRQDEQVDVVVVTVPKALSCHHPEDEQVGVCVSVAVAL